VQNETSTKQNAFVTMGSSGGFLAGDTEERQKKLKSIQEF